MIHDTSTNTLKWIIIPRFIFLITIPLKRCSEEKPAIIFKLDSEMLLFRNICLRISVLVSYAKEQRETFLKSYRDTAGKTITIRNVR